MLLSLEAPGLRASEAVPGPDRSEGSANTHYQSGECHRSKEWEELPNGGGRTGSLHLDTGRNFINSLETEIWGPRLMKYAR